MTAGNSTPLTDGAAAVLLASEDWARKKNLPILAYLTFVKAAAVDFINSEGLLMAPAYAVSDMLKQANLRLQDFDFYEIHEAFAAQTISTLKAWQSEKFCRERLGAQRTDGGRSTCHDSNVKGRQHRDRSPVCRYRRGASSARWPRFSARTAPVAA